MQLGKYKHQVILPLIKESVAQRILYIFSGDEEFQDEQGSVFLSKETRISMERMQIKDKVSLTHAFEMSFQC